MILLDTLPREHPLRNAPLEGAWKRVSIPTPFDIADPPDKIERIKIRQQNGERKFTTWKQVLSWKISTLCYNDLSPIWTDHHEWSFDSPQ